MTDPNLLGDHLVQQAATSLGASSAAIYLKDMDQLVLKHTYGNWRGAAMVSVPINFSGDQLGLIQLGRRANGKNYQRYEVDSLSSVAEHVAKILAVNRVASTLEQDPE